MFNVDYYPEKTSTENSVRNIENTEVRSKKRKKTSVETMAKLIGLGSVFLILTASILFLIGYSNISKMQMEVNKLESYRNNLLKEKTDLTAELEGIKSSKEINDIALYKLGMTYPKEDQVVYISVADEIKKEKVQNKTEEKVKIKWIKNFFSDLF